MSPQLYKTLDQVVREHLEVVLDHCGGNKTRAAAILGVTAKTVHNKLNQYKAADRAVRERIPLRP